MDFAYSGNNYNSSIMGGMYSSYGSNNGMQMGSMNSNQALIQKYGCPDCFISKPYEHEYPMTLPATTKSSLKPSLLKRIFNKLMAE